MVFMFITIALSIILISFLFIPDLREIKKRLYIPIILVLVILIAITGHFWFRTMKVPDPYRKDLNDISINRAVSSSNAKIDVEQYTEKDIYDIFGPKTEEVCNELGILDTFTIDKIWYTSPNTLNVYFYTSMCTTVLYGVYDGINEPIVTVYGSFYHKGFPGIIFNADLDKGVSWKYVEDQLIQAGAKSICQVDSITDTNVLLTDREGNTYNCDKHR